jgi:hypothetical protein
MKHTTNLVPGTTQQSTPLNIIEFIILYDGETTYTVSKDFYDSVRCQIDDILPAVKSGEKYTLEMLCGPGFWELLEDGERKMAGRCMANMVFNGLLPLTFADSRHEYPKYYRLS